MDLLSLIKEKITGTVIDRLSVFLGEHPEKIESAFHNALPTVLGGIVQNAQTPEETAKIMDILRDGGHTGAILDDLPTLLSNYDKTQVLITIGSNISNHLFGEKTNHINETLSNVNGIRKTSASSLVSLSTPLVLGAIGKVADREGLGVSGLMKLLAGQRDAVQKALPPVLFNLLGMKTQSSVLSTEMVEEVGNFKEKEIQQEVKPTVVTTKKSDKNLWIPWLLLILLGLFALIWVKQVRKDTLKSTKLSDSLASISIPKPSIEDSATVINTDPLVNPEDVIKKEDLITIEKQDKANEIIVGPPLKNPVNQPPKGAKPVKTEEENIKEIGSRSPVETNNGTLTQKLDENPDTWVGIGKVNYKKASGELTNKGELTTLVNYLKKHPKTTLKIGANTDGDNVLAEDRAYAVRDILIESGINENRIDIITQSVKSTDGQKIAVKIIK